MKEPLSARQAEIVDLVTRGNSNREIAELACLSERTVENHVSSILRKFGIRSRTALAGAVAGAAVRGEPPFASGETNLPSTPKRLIGRDPETTQIAALLSDYRLVTLMGPGGIGKTEVALRVGRDTAQAQHGGVWLVELAALNDPALVGATIAQVLNVRFSSNQAAVESLIAFLRNRVTLLVLDSCEHVIGEAANVAAQLVRDCPDLRILATSRERLKIHGERTYRLSSLRFPPVEVERALDAAKAGAYGALELFAQRARTVDREFTISDENAPLVARICRRLEGIPLAIELAAARLGTLNLAALSEKLERRLGMLSLKRHTTAARHRTIRALIDWSYDLLTVSEQRLFERLSIFAGGCSLVAADAVCADGGADEVTTYALISSLVDKSLLNAELDRPEPRYRLAEPVRQYARERLIERGELDLVARRHANAYLQLAERLECARETIPDDIWLAKTQLELENWRTAFTSTFHGRGDVLVGQRLAGALRQVFGTYALADGHRWIRIALDAVDGSTPPEVTAKLEFAQASVATILGETKTALAAANRALETYRALGDEVGIAWAQTLAGRSLVFMGTLGEGEALLRASLRTVRALGHRPLLALVLSALGSARSHAGDVAGARAYLAEELEIWKSIGSSRSVAITTANLAEAEFQCGNAQIALVHAEEALAAFRAFNYSHNIVHALCVVAAYLTALDRFDDARAPAHEALVLARELGLGVLVIRALQRVAAMAALEAVGDAQRQETALESAALIVGFVDAQLPALGAVREYTDQQEYERTFAVLEAGLGRMECERLLALGATMGQDGALEKALILSRLPKAHDAPGGDAASGPKSFLDLDLT